jgi:hypothetical protein
MLYLLGSTVVPLPAPPSRNVICRWGVHVPRVLCSFFGARDMHPGFISVYKSPYIQHGFWGLILTWLNHINHDLGDSAASKLQSDCAVHLRWPTLLASCEFWFKVASFATLAQEGAPLKTGLVPCRATEARPRRLVKIEAAALVAFACCVFHCDQIHLRLEPSPNTLSLSAPATESPKWLVYNGNTENNMDDLGVAPPISGYFQKSILTAY